MAQQTAVEWLEEKFNNYDISTGKAYFRKLLNEAKQIEKEQHKNTWFDSRIVELSEENICIEKTFEQYYKETFNNK